VTSEGYSETVLEHFERPRNNRELEDANAIGFMTNPVCGDTLLLMLRIIDGRIEEVGWKSDGCAASIAASSVVSELVVGKPIDEVASITREAVVEALGGLPLSKLHAGVLAADAVDMAIKDWRSKSTEAGT
jgi:NifU-like protein involved in Fe-S cluster formation